MRRLKALGIGGAVLLCGVAAYAVFASRHPTPKLLAFDLRQRVDRRCRFGCSQAQSALQNLLDLLPGGPSSAQIATGVSLTTQQGGAVTLARSTVTGCTGSVNLTALDSGQPCVEPGGLAVRPATSNLVANSNNLDAGTWALTGVTIVVNNAIGPDGTMSASTFTDNSANSAHRLQQGGINNQGAGWYTVNWYIKAGTAAFSKIVIGNTGSVGVRMSDCTIAAGNGFNISWNPANGGSTTPHIQKGPNGFCWLSMSFKETCCNYGNFNLYVADTYAHLASDSYQGTSSNSIVVGNPMVTFTQDVRPYNANTAASGLQTRVADVVSVANPLKAADSSWCIRGAYTPDGNDWDQGLSRTLWQLGPADGGANSASLVANGTAGLVFTVIDNDAGTKVLTSTLSAPMWSGRRVVRACDAAGQLSFSEDTRTLAATVTDGGTGIITTQPATLFVANNGATGQFGGLVSDFCVDNTAAGCPALAAIRPTQPSQSLTAMGDSLTGPGPLDTIFWPTVFASALPSWNVTNDGIGGYEFIDFYPQFVNTIRPAGPTAYTTIEGGINDCANAEGPSTNYFWYYKVIYDMIDASGSQVSPIIESPWAHSSLWSAGVQTNYDKLQTALADWCANTGHLCFNAYTSALSDGQTPPSIACAYDYVGCDAGTPPSHVHLNNAGQAYVEAQMRSLLGI